MFAQPRQTRRTHAGILAVVAILVCTGAVQAADVTIAIQAQVEFVDDPAGAFGDTIQPGGVISGTYTYNTATPDSNALPTVGDYWHDISPSPYGIILTAGGHVFQTDPNNVNFLVEIVNDHGIPASDNYLLRSYTNLPLVNGYVVEHISWQLDDPTLAALSSEALPVDAPVLADWQSFFGITITGCPAEDFNGVFCNSLSTFFIRAHVTSAIKNSGGDSDGDGIADAEDACPNSDLSSTVVIDSCDSGVPNQLSTEGCTTTDQIVDCTEAAINHRAFVRCVQALTTRLASAHLITNRQKSAIDRCAVRADIP